jgi:hypothetical protein
MLIFSSLTMHRSDDNKSFNPRRAYVAQYSTEPIIDPDSGENRRFATPLLDLFFNQLIELFII